MSHQRRPDPPATVVGVHIKAAPALAEVVHPRKPQRQARDDQPLVIGYPCLSTLGLVLPTELQLRLVQRLAAVMWALGALRPLRHLMEKRKVQVFTDVHLSDIRVLTMAPANVNVIWFLSGDLVDLRRNTAPGSLSRNVRLQIVRL